MANDLTIGSGSSGAIDNAPVVTNLPGGTISFQTGRASDIIDSRFPNETTRGGVNNGEGYRTDANGNAEEFGAITKLQTTEPEFNDDPLLTAMTPWGSATSHITRTTVLNFGHGQQVAVATALVLGWLREDGPGRYVVSGKHKADIAAATGQR